MQAVPRDPKRKNIGGAEGGHHQYHMHQCRVPFDEQQAQLGARTVKNVAAPLLYVAWYWLPSPISTSSGCYMQDYIHADHFISLVALLDPRQSGSTACDYVSSSISSSTTLSLPPFLCSVPVLRCAANQRSRADTVLEQEVSSRIT